MQLHLRDSHQCDLVTDCDKDWAVSQDLQLKLKIHCFHRYSHQPCQEEAAADCSFSTSSCSASVDVSVDVADQNVIKDQSLASQHYSKTTSASIDVTAASESVSSDQDVAVTSSVTRWLTVVMVALCNRADHYIFAL